MAPATAAKSKATKAPKGEGMDPATVSRMLGVLKYKADASRNKSGENLEEANKALKLYSTMDAESKKRFLNDFENNGRGKGKNALKFITSFEHSLVHANVCSASSEEDFFTMPQILEMNGLRWQDFKSPNEAKTIALGLIDANKKEYQHDKEAIVNDAFPDLLTKYFYVKSGGIKRKEVWTDEEKLHRKTDLKPGQTAEFFGAAASSSVKGESEDFQAFGVKLTSLKVAFAALQKSGQQGDMLVRKMFLRAKTEPSVKGAADELNSKVQVFTNHINKVADFVTEMDTVTSDDGDLKNRISIMVQLTVESDHHIGGFKEMYKRFTAIAG